MIFELKKLDQLIKKTEKEERQLDKLVKNEQLRQASTPIPADPASAPADDDFEEPVWIAQKPTGPEKWVEIKVDHSSTNYLASEKIYRQFQHLAKRSGISEDALETKVRSILGDKYVPFESVTASRTVCQKYKDMIKLVEQAIKSGLSK